MPAAAATAECCFTCTPEKCVYCGKDDYEKGDFGPRTFVKCSGCGVNCMHVDCMQLAGHKVDASIMEPDAVCTCSEVCQKIHDAWQAKTGKTWPLAGEQEYTLEIVKFKEGDRAIETTVEAAIKIFRSSFKMLMMDNGRDIVEMVCQGYESPIPDDEEEAAKTKKTKGAACSRVSGEDSEEEEEDFFSFGEFRLLVLRKGKIIVTVATLRIFGPYFAEMPFVSTRAGYRREGNCRRLVRAVDALLHELGVQYLVLPSVTPVLPMWTNKFGFTKLSEQEHQVLRDCEIVDMDPDTTHLVKRRVGLQTIEAPHKTEGPGDKKQPGGTKSRPNSQRVLAPPPGADTTTAPAKRGQAAKRDVKATTKGATAAKGTSKGLSVTSKKRGGRPAAQRGRTPTASSGTGNDSSSSDSSSDSDSSDEEESSSAEGSSEEDSPSSSSDDELDAEDLEVAKRRGGAAAAAAASVVDEDGEAPQHRLGSGRGQGRGRGRGRGGRGAARPVGPPGPPKVPRKVWPAPPQVQRYAPGEVPPEMMEELRRFRAAQAEEAAREEAERQAAIAAGLAPAIGPWVPPSSLTQQAPATATGTTAAPKPPAPTPRARATPGTASARKRASPAAPRAAAAAGAAQRAQQRPAPAQRAPAWTAEEKKQILELSVVSKARKAVRTDTVLAVTLAESIAQAMLGQDSVDQLKHQIARTEGQVLALQQYNDQLIQLLHAHGIQPPAPPAAQSLPLPPFTPWRPANPHTPASLLQPDTTIFRAPGGSPTTGPPGSPGPASGGRQMVQHQPAQQPTHAVASTAAAGQHKAFCQSDMGTGLSPPPLPTPSPLLPRQGAVRPAVTPPAWTVLSNCTPATAQAQAVGAHTAVNTAAIDPYAFDDQQYDHPMEEVDNMPGLSLTVTSPAGAVETIAATEARPVTVESSTVAGPTRAEDMSTPAAVAANGTAAADGTAHIAAQATVDPVAAQPTSACVLRRQLHGGVPGAPQATAVVSITDTAQLTQSATQAATQPAAECGNLLALSATQACLPATPTRTVTTAGGPALPLTTPLLSGLANAQPGTLTNTAMEVHATLRGGDHAPLTTVQVATNTDQSAKQLQPALHATSTASDGQATLKPAAGGSPQQQQQGMDATNTRVSEPVPALPVTADSGVEGVLVGTVAHSPDGLVQQQPVRVAGGDGGTTRPGPGNHVTRNGSADPRKASVQPDAIDPTPRAQEDITDMVVSVAGAGTGAGTPPGAPAGVGEVVSGAATPTATPSKPPSGGGGNGTGARTPLPQTTPQPEESPPFASPNTVQRFDSVCLGQLLPCVLNSWLGSSPDSGRVVATAAPPASVPGGAGHAAATPTDAPDSPMLTIAADVHVPARATAAAAAGSVAASPPRPVGVAASQPAAVAVTQAQLDSVLEASPARPSGSSKRPPKSGGSSKVAAAESKAVPPSKRRRLSMQLVESVFGLGLVGLESERSGGSSGSSSGDDLVAPVEGVAGAAVQITTAPATTFLGATPQLNGRTPHSGQVLSLSDLLSSAGDPAFSHAAAQNVTPAVLQPVPMEGVRAALIDTPSGALQMQAFDVTHATGSPTRANPWTVQPGPSTEAVTDAAGGVVLLHPAGATGGVSTLALRAVRVANSGRVSGREGAGVRLDDSSMDADEQTALQTAAKFWPQV